MKKILSAILAGTMMCSMAIGFAGCGGSGEASKTETTAPAETKAVSTADSATKDSANKGENGELHMATNAFFEPYEYYENDKIVGIDAEIAEAICDKLGYTLVIDDMDFDSIITAVQSGKADFGMAGMTVTEERKQAIDFTDTYTNAVQVIIEVDAVVIDNEPAKAFVAQNEGLVILDEPFENEEYAICVAKGSELTEKINGALAALKEEGKVDEIINKYIKA